jgi:hypothetical protein
MESYWCEKKNDIRNLKNIPIALTPCLKDKCELWGDGYEWGSSGGCIHIHITGEPDRQQLFGKESYRLHDQTQNENMKWWGCAHIRKVGK